MTTRKSTTKTGKSTSTPTRIRAPRAQFGQVIGTPDSDSVSYLRYDDTRNVLRVLFREGRQCYDYFGFYAYDLATLLGAKSLGKALNEIKSDGRTFKKVLGAF